MVLALAVMIVGVIAAVGFGSAFTASATVPAAHNAGFSANASGGFTLSAVHYTLDVTNSKVEAVNFGISPAVSAGGTLKVRLISGGAWFTCTTATATPTCDTSGTEPLVTATDTFDVVAAD